MLHKKVLRCSGSLIYKGVMECRRRALLLPHRSTAAPVLIIIMHFIDKSSLVQSLLLSHAHYDCSRHT